MKLSEVFELKNWCEARRGELAELTMTQKDWASWLKEKTGLNVTAFYVKEVFMELGLNYRKLSQRESEKARYEMQVASLEEDLRTSRAQYMQAVDLIQDLARTHPDLSEQMKQKIDRMSDLRVKVAQFTKNGGDLVAG